MFWLPVALLTFFLSSLFHKLPLKCWVGFCFSFPPADRPIIPLPSLFTAFYSRSSAPRHLLFIRVGRNPTTSYGRWDSFRRPDAAFLLGPSTSYRLSVYRDTRCQTEAALTLRMPKSALSYNSCGKGQLQCFKWIPTFLCLLISTQTSCEGLPLLVINKNLNVG
jgi:hypothetical protein